MDKSKKNKSVYNDVIIKELMIKYGFGRDYIMKSIRGERVGTIPIKIQEEYKALLTASNQIIKQQISQL
jgi:hypothetical protein